jgi:hypothetical protein
VRTYAREKKELREYGFPDRVLTSLNDLMTLNNYHVHMKARKDLVKQGERILPVMYRLMKSDSVVIREQAAKIMKLIRHRSSIPVAIEMMEDSWGEIRWIAAETLIRIGRDSIRPLLKALVENGTSYYLREGAHHVLSELVTEEDPEELLYLLHVSLKGMDLPETVPVRAEKILNDKLV